MNDSEGQMLLAGKNFPWEYITGFYLRLTNFTQLAVVNGDTVGSKTLGAYGLASAELPNPDVEPVQRLVTLPIEHKSDYKSLYRANLDSGVSDGANELIILHENRKGFLGRRQPSLPVAAYPNGTWLSFFEAVDDYRSEDFRWPEPLFLYQPSSSQVFPSKGNLYMP